MLEILTIQYIVLGRLISVLQQGVYRMVSM